MSDKQFTQLLDSEYLKTRKYVNDKRFLGTPNGSTFDLISEEIRREVKRGEKPVVFEYSDFEDEPVIQPNPRGLKNLNDKSIKNFCRILSVFKTKYISFVNVAPGNEYKLKPIQDCLGQSVKVFTTAEIQEAIKTFRSDLKF